MRFFVLFLAVFYLIGCGSEFNRKSPTAKKQTTTTQAGEPAPGTVVSYCAMQTGTPTKDCPAQGPIVTTPVVGAPVIVGGTVVGGAVPPSYTFLDTPDANICVDAFNRIGVDIPDTAVARTLNINNMRMNGIAYTDGDTPGPVMNIVRLNSKYSNVIFQFLNSAGFYCLIYDNASFSNVSIQYKCSAQKTSIEPITINTVNSTPKYGFFDWIFGGHGGDYLHGTQDSYNSRIQELPCIP